MNQHDPDRPLILVIDAPEIDLSHLVDAEPVICVYCELTKEDA